jgi:UDP-N-acetylglucosamine--N-acetylmuramyl-(pentapeptide) pyrophosphoryl-undecaprenol N-acetylglucosamine transferase
MNLLIACGGTAGHINPAIAIANCLHAAGIGAKILFVGAGRELEKRLIGKAGYDLVNIKMTGLRRGVTPKDMLYNAKTVRNLVTAGNEAERIIKDFSPNAAIGTGGYVCYPVLRKASQMGIPTFIHEANAVPGLTTKMLSATADMVMVSFPGLEKQYRKPERVVFTGMPVRGDFSRLREYVKPPRAKPLVVSFWGSLGASRMNELMGEFIKLNSVAGLFDHIHATGNNADILRESLKGYEIAEEQLPEGIEIREYIDDMATVMSEADLVLCRAGASTVAELTIIGKPAILVPSPYVTDNHQEKNALALQKAGGAVMVPEKECTGARLFDEVVAILRDHDKRGEMSEAQKNLATPGAAERIVGLIVGRAS